MDHAISKALAAGCNLGWVSIDAVGRERKKAGVLVEQRTYEGREGFRGKVDQTYLLAASSLGLLGVAVVALDQGSLFDYD